MRGTLWSYCLLCIHQFRPLQRLATAAAWVLFLFLLCSLVGRFGVAFLGFAFVLEDIPHYTPALFRPNWETGTVHGDDSHDADLAKLTGDTFHSKGMEFRADPRPVLSTY